MPDINTDIAVVRELARRYMDVALSERHVKMRRRFLDTNNLKIVRPPVIIEEIPWHEMNFAHELDCLCADGELRNIEYSLRAALFRERHFKCDNFIEPVWAVGKSYSSTGWGGAGVSETRLATDINNGIVSHEYNDVLADERALETYHEAIITPHPAHDARNVARMNEIFGGIIPVELRGHGIYWAPWDQITTLRGMDVILEDVYDRPEYLHKIIALFTRLMKNDMDQMEKYDLYDNRGMSLHCTPAAVSVPERSPAGGKCRDIWFRTMAQSFSSISPAAHEEFDMQYSAPLAARCAFTYYGCCEPLHDRIDKLKKNYKNLRKVGVSPWADVERSAEQLGGEFVLSRKPNPANVAGVVDAAVVRGEVEATVKAAAKHGCPFDYTLKDISTVGYRPQNLFEWSAAVADVLDGYFE